MNIRHRFGLSLIVTAALLATAVVIFTRGFVIEIRASADTPPLLPDAAEANKAKGGSLPAAGDVLVVGGMGSGKTKMKTLSTAEFYNPTKGEFFQTGSLPVTAAVQGASLASSSPGAKVVAFGGISGIGHANVHLLSFTGTVVANAESYDPSAGTWSAAANMMSTPRAGATATLLPSGMILIAGGFDASENALNTAEIFNPADGTFVATDNTMTDPRAFHTANLLLSGKVLLVSGLTDNSGSLSSTADIFDPIAGTHGVFTESTGFPTKSAAAASVLFPSGTLAGEVLITGGDNCPSLSVCSATTGELYNPGTDQFTFPTPMNESRLTHAATLLQNGTVLIAGGFVARGRPIFQMGSATKSAEIFDPASATFKKTKSMHRARGGHTAALLQ